jgi:intracellular multiplication protein IcmK
MKRKITTLLIAFFVLSATSCLAAAPEGNDNQGQGLATDVTIPSPTEAEKQAMGRDLIDETLKLTPEDIIYLKEALYKRKEAAQASPTPPPRPITRTIILNMSPGTQPPVIRVSERNGASIIFTDSTGTDWPVIDENNFAQDIFTTLVPIKDGPILNIAANGAYGQGNVAVFLKDLSVPVILNVVVGQKETDYRVDVRIAKRGPNAQEIIVGTSKAPPSFDKTLMDVLSGIPPLNSRTLKIVPDNQSANFLTDTKAWLAGREIFLRTPHFPISPGVLDSQSSNDGMKAYKFSETPLILLSINGKIYRVKVEL